MHAPFTNDKPYCGSAALASARVVPGKQTVAAMKGRLRELLSVWQWGLILGQCLARALPAADAPSVLMTGAGAALVSTQQVLQVSMTIPAPRLQFDFGFASDEIPTTNSFVDSFSVTLQVSGPSTTLLLLTVDAFGVQWAPPNPGGMDWSTANISRQQIPFPIMATNLDFRLAYSVSLTLPPDFAGHTATLFLDLFDNANQLSSLGFLDHLAVVPSVLTNGPSGFALQSSASVTGPFSDESGVVTNALTRTMSVSRYGQARFYHIRSDSQVVITSFQIQTNDLVLRYEFPSPQVTVQSAFSVEGPYSDVTNAVVSLATRTITVPESGAARFYRLRSNIRARIVSSQSAGQQLLLSFAYQPAVFGVQSSAAASGPYADENGALVDLGRQTVTLSRMSAARFYRIRADRSHTMTSIRFVGDQLLFGYE
jgi:hypothetical protein